MEEVETEDIKKLGRFCYVSCWTDNEEELISLWNMYTPNMQGIRIKLIERLENSNFNFPYDRYFLKLDEQALSNMQILLGPKVTEAQMEIVDMMVKRYCPTAQISKSTLKIR